MPLNGQGTASKPGGSTAQPDTTISSSMFNGVVDDIYLIFNTERPLSKGGTGVSTAMAAWDVFNSRGGSLATAATLNLNNATGANLHLTGTTAVTAVTLGEGKIRSCIADAAFTLTASANLIVNGSDAQNYDVAAGDLITFIGEPSSVVRAWVTTAPAGDAGVTGINEVFIPATAFTPQVTNGAAYGLAELATTLQPLETLDFDTTTQEFAVYLLPLPKRWNLGTITFRAYWTAASGSGGVAWAAQGVAVSDDDALAAAYGTEQVVTDTFIAANDLHITAESAAITIAGTPADADGIWLRVKRVPANGSDNLTADAKLIGLKVFFTVDQGNDA